MGRYNVAIINYSYITIPVGICSSTSRSLGILMFLHSVAGRIAFFPNLSLILSIVSSNLSRFCTSVASEKRVNCSASDWDVRLIALTVTERMSLFQT